MPQPPDSLTPREKEVLALLRRGLTNEEIAQRLGISLDGAKYHVSQILSKLGVATREEAATWRSQQRGAWWAQWPLWAKAGLSATAAAGALGVLALVAVIWDGGPGEVEQGSAAESRARPSRQALAPQGTPTPGGPNSPTPLSQSPTAPKPSVATPSPSSGNAFESTAPGAEAGVPPPSFIVNATHDAIDASPGDGVCADAGGACTLRAAVIETNAQPGADVISLPAGTYLLSIPGTGEDAGATGDLDVVDSLIVNGAGVDSTLIDGAGVDRVFHAIGSFGFAIADLSIQGGVAGASNAGDDCNPLPGDQFNPGEDFANGGGVCSGSATLDLMRMRFRYNRAGVGGGAIHSMGDLRLVESLIEGNSGGRGAIFNGGTATIESSVVAGNSGAIIGGGITNDTHAILDIRGSTVDRNTALDAGGGIHNGGKATITETTIADNTAGQTGGAVHNSAISVLELSDSTISGNASRFGGGIYNNPEPQLGPGPDGLPPPTGSASAIKETAQSLGGRVIATNVTLAGNSASQGGGIWNVDMWAGAGIVELRNTIVAQSSSGGDCAGAVASHGFNLDSDGTCALAGPGDISNADPKLGPLADNGGPTRTHALLAGSPAIDAGNNAGCPATDQRGVARPQDGDGNGSAICDIGAFEA